MRDFAAFSTPGGDKSALLVECGQHWKRESREVAIAVCFHFLRVFEAIPAERAHAGAPLPAGPQHVIEVTEAITAGTGAFRFAEDYVGLEVIACTGTTIAYNGDTPVTTPYDDCVLIMPSRRLKAGQTAIRFGRYAA